MRYTPLGVRMLTGPGSGVTTVAGFKGAFSDAEDGMWMMGGRKYDPTVGRFISEDPAGLSGGINLYTFGGADPVNGYDPEGRFNVNGFDLYVEHLLLLGGFMAFGAPYIFEDFTLFLEAHGAASVGLVADLAGFTQSLESQIEEALLVGAIHEGLIDHDLDGDDGAPENGLLDIAGFLAFPLGHEVAVAAGTLDAAGVVGGSYVAWRDNHPVQPRYALGTLDQRCVPQVSVGTGLSAFPTTAAAQSLSGRFWDPKRPGVIQGQSPSRAANGQCATP
jgi:RHS repeat-associated protein